MARALSTLFLHALLSAVGGTGLQACLPRDVGGESVVCVCTAAHCDFLEPLRAPNLGSFVAVTSSKDGLRFHVTEGQLDEKAKGGGEVTVVPGRRFQNILGFGGAITDSTGLNVALLSKGAQQMWLRSYFSPEGLEYNLLRVPIGGTDFSVRPYTYDDVPGDVDLHHFALAEEDFVYKLPLIRAAMKLSHKKILVFGCPWSPPAWMKTNGKLNETGELRPEFWDSWANYMVKFVEAYEEEHVPIWGVSAQNGPTETIEPEWTFNTCAWKPQDICDWIRESMGPALARAGLRRVKLLSPDISRKQIMSYIPVCLDDPGVAKIMDGISLHWYMDKTISADILDTIHDAYPDKFILYTEACKLSSQDQLQLGSWQNAQNYASSIIETVNHWSTGWVDWNMALNLQGGPNWASNYVYAPTIVNKEADEFYKEPIFYVMGHFSKFIPQGSVRILTKIKGGEDIDVAAFETPSGLLAVVFLNKGIESAEISVGDDSGKFLNLHVPAKAIQTVLANLSSEVGVRDEF